MIPLYSEHKVSHFPFATILLITINIAMFWNQLKTSGSVSQSVWVYGVIPLELFNPEKLNIAGRVSPLISLVTGMFTHGGLFHLGSNMLYLWVFGRDVEDDFGPVNFLVFYLCAGLLSTAAFIAAFPGTNIPLVGASGAIAGLLGVYFLRFPFRRIYCLFFFIIIIRIVALPAVVMLGLWFAIQFFSCMLVVTAGAAGQGGVAWLSHIAGFLVGIVWTLLVLRKRYFERRYG